MPTITCCSPSAAIAVFATLPSPWETSLRIELFQLEYGTLDSSTQTSSATGLLWAPPSLTSYLSRRSQSLIKITWLASTFSSPHACCRPQQCWGRARRYQKPTPDILCSAFFLTYTSIEGVSVRYAYDREGRHLRHLLSQLQHVRSHILGSKESVFWPPKVPHLPKHESKLKTCSIFRWIAFLQPACLFLFPQQLPLICPHNSVSTYRI